MKLQLIIQCIDTFGFKSPKDKLYFFINGNPIETIHKDNGFYSIIEKLPEKFILLIKSSVYYSYECTVKLKEKINYLSVNLIRKIPPLHEPTVWIDTVGYTKAVLGFGYFFLADSLKNMDIFISVDNPFRFCLEGRKFLIRDTQSLKEEFITIEKAENNLDRSSSPGKDIERVPASGYETKTLDQSEWHVGLSDHRQTYSAISVLRK